MKKLRIITKLAVAFIAAGALAFTAVQAAEKEEKETKDADETVSIEKIPAAVAKTIKAEAAGGKIAKIQKGDEDGKVIYEVVLKSGATSREITVSPDGKLLGEEVEIKLAEAPEAVRAAIEKHAAGAKIGKVERVKADGKVTYEAAIDANGKKHVVEVSEKGKVLGTEAAEKD
jgi:uncharacterized membrane protein YkoI